MNSALDAYAYDVVWPGKSCVTANPPQEEGTHSAPVAVTSTVTVSISEPTATAEAVEDDHAGHDHAAEETATPTATAAEHCHTHADGEVSRFCSCSLLPPLIATSSS